VIAELPLFEGATHVTLAEAFPAVALTCVGEPGTLATGIAHVSSDAVEDPTGFTASTVK
jgi:hypothetical protein